MDFLAVATGAGREVARLTAEAEPALFQINLFWVIVSALNFLLFFAIIWTFALQAGLPRCWPTARSGIEQGLKDAEQARAATARAPRPSASRP